MRQNGSGISGLLAAVDSLPPAERQLFHRIYQVSQGGGKMRLPEAMQGWVKDQFGSLEAVTNQKITRVTNRITLQETLFNPLRTHRPIAKVAGSSLQKHLEEAHKQDVFANPPTMTPEDAFGRVSGRHCITAANISGYDAVHSLVIFNEFHPLKFNAEQVADYIDTALKWAHKANSENPEARFFFFCWNCLWRAGATIAHGHAHVMLGANRHYGKIEALRRAAASYQQQYGQSYFENLYRVHQSLGLAHEKDGVKTLAHLTPFKKNEMLLLANEINPSFKKSAYKALAALRDKAGMTSFNLGLATPPLGKEEADWQGFPVMCNIVDRGDTSIQSSDIGGVEISASNVVSSDPFALFAQLAPYLS